MKALNPYILPGDLVFDVGANLGNCVQEYSLRGAKVVAFEPNKELADHLHQRFSHTNSVYVENKALSSSSGLINFQICSQAPAISTCSTEWHTGRFKQYTWDKEVTVACITLDQCIDFFGLPKYIKIDVEGYEFQVLSGLSKPVDFLSFEFTSEFMHNSVACVNHLEHIGMTHFNLGLKEHETLFIPKWLSSRALKAMIADLTSQHINLWGDIYASKTSITCSKLEKMQSTYQIKTV
ncbi:FkbM family methyltransferase [Desulfomicrobium macestii]|uniref:FkbM family methyltransferase n=1 Tax=Desulfomicrobium macestii TaxID=90731 RepID=A0ABR9H9S6_9BACT|nr:FkbM family methyltransferase [Desulfomicrobium macestii]MBE1427430.1 FkbM family methyltransferase [Desulfomicrobium macestii]